MKSILVSILVLVAAVLAVSSTPVTAILPAQVCGWPFCRVCPKSDPGCLMCPTETVQIFTHALNGILNSNVSSSPAGYFSSEIASLVRKFQNAYRIEGDGEMGTQTFSKLAEVVAPIRPGGPRSLSSTQKALFIQTGLINNGFHVPLSGVFDGLTVKALRAFQVQRKDDVTTGEEVSAKTVHLLLTGCNSPGAFFVDIGWPQSAVDVNTFKCLKKAGFEFLTQEAWIEGRDEHGQGLFWQDAVNNIKNARDAGFEQVGVYMFPRRQYSAAAQVRMLIANLTHNKVDYDSVMLDIEGGDWKLYTQAQNREFMLEIKQTLISLGKTSIVVYCGRQWPDYFGEGFDDFKDYPEVYAHYDQVPSTYDLRKTWGGWQVKQFSKQFWDGSQGIATCGIQLDWDFSPNPFWRK